MGSKATKHTAQILFEEIFFNDDDKSFKVLCISCPLESALVSQGKDKVFCIF